MGNKTIMLYKFKRDRIFFVITTSVTKFPQIVSTSCRKIWVTYLASIEEFVILITELIKSEFCRIHPITLINVLQNAQLLNFSIFYVKYFCSHI